MPKRLGTTGLKDFADVIKLRIFRWGGYLGLSKWAQYNHKVLIRGSESVADVTMKPRGCNDVRKGSQAKEGRWLLEGQVNRFSYEVSRWNAALQAP